VVEIDGTTLALSGASFIALLLFIIAGLYFMRSAPTRQIKKKAHKRPKEQLTLPTHEKDYENDEYNPITYKISRFSMKYWRNWWKNRKNTAIVNLINMELTNGFHKLFLVTEKEEGFRYRGKKYLFDTESKYYIIDTKMWAYDYHEKFSLPIKRIIPVTEIRKTLEASSLTEIEYATNPSTLERFAVSKIAEGIMRGAELDQVFRFLKIMVIIILVVTIIHLVLFAQKSGILDQVPTSF